MRREPLLWGSAELLLLLTSIWLVGYCAGKEPFFRFRAEDLWALAVGGSVNWTLKLVLSAGLSARLFRTGRHMAGGVYVLWSSLMLWYIAYAPFCIIGDLDRFLPPECRSP